LPDQSRSESALRGTGLSLPRPAVMDQFANGGMQLCAGPFRPVSRGVARSRRLSLAAASGVEAPTPPIAHLDDAGTGPSARLLSATRRAGQRAFKAA